MIFGQNGGFLIALATLTVNMYKYLGLEEEIFNKLK